MKHVLVFTMDGCPHCTDFKDMLTKEGIEYIEADINEKVTIKTVPDISSKYISTMDIYR